MKRPSVVLVSPRDPGNVGSIGRSVVGLGHELIIVGPVGFDLGTDNALKRAQLDYWHLLKWRQFRAWSDFLAAHGGVEQLRNRAFFFTAHEQSRTLDEVDLTSESDSPLLVFGSETSGFRGLIPDDQLARFRTVKIPMDEPKMRCYNLSVSAGIVLWEAASQAKRRPKD